MIQIIHPSERRKMARFKKKAPPKPGRNAIYIYIDDGKENPVKYSQWREPFHFLFSMNKQTEEIQEERMRAFRDSAGVVHGMVKYDENKIYLQAKNIVHASLKFKEFAEKHLQYEKDHQQKNESKK